MTMKDDEKLFFRICVKYRNREVAPVRIREIVNILYDAGVMHYKRCWYLLRKWDKLGFYSYGVTEDLGWFYIDQFPDRYADLLEDNQ